MGKVRRKQEVKETEPASDTLRRIISILFTLAGIVLIFRFVFKLFGANPDNQFVDFLYGITEPYVGIFSGIFAETEWGNGVFEPATLIALVVLFVVSWLIQSLFAKRTVRREEYVASEEDAKHQRPTENTSDPGNNERVRKEEYQTKEVSDAEGSRVQKKEVEEEKIHDNLDEEKAKKG